MVVNVITLKSDELYFKIDFANAAQDVVFHCGDGLVTTNSLLLATVSTNLRKLLEWRTEQEEQFHLSCPGLRAGNITAFLGAVYGRHGDINVTHDVQCILFPEKSAKGMKIKEIKPDDMKFEPPPAPDTTEDPKEEVEDYIDDFYEDKIEHSDEESIPESDGESDSDYEKPKPKKKKKVILKDPSTGRFEKKSEGARPYKKITILSKKLTKSGKLRNPEHFYCSVCDCYFRQFDVMINHVSKSHGPKPAPQCDVCSITFDTHGKMVYHKKIVHREEVPCPDCGKSYIESQLNEHIKRVHEVSEPQSCEFCGATFTNEYKFKHHKKTHMEDNKGTFYAKEKWLEKFNENCFCKLEFKTERKKINHYKIFHENFIECVQCKQVVKNQRKHKCGKPQSRKLSEPESCSECGKICYSASSLWYHVKTAHSDPSTCELCGKVFASEVHMKSHLQFHKEKSACPICGKQVADLKYHIGSVHTEESDKKFQCSICGKGFTQKRYLHDHMNIHLNKKPYQCRHGCDMAYSDRSNRNQHERKVHGVRGGFSREKSKNNTV